MKKIFLIALALGLSQTANAQVVSSEARLQELLQRAGVAPSDNSAPTTSPPIGRGAEGSLSYDSDRFPQTPVDIPIGTVAHGVIDMAVNSDYPGPWRGRLTHAIYSADQRHVIFPEGSIITGRAVRATGVNEAIHNRMLFFPQYITRSQDGLTVDISALSVLDKSGIAGLKDKVDRHLDIQAAAIGGASVAEALPTILENLVIGDNSAIAGSALFQTQERALEIIEKYLDLVPTIEIRPGAEFRLFFSEPSALPPLENRAILTAYGRR